jgi:lipoprotein signal peptidase
MIRPKTGSGSFVIACLNRYYAVGLVLALLVPFWLIALSSDAGSGPGRRDALIWTGVLLGGWLLVSRSRRYEIRGCWRGPTHKEVKLYIRLLLGVLLVDFGSKALFFRWDRPQKVELLPNFGLHSVFHETGFETFHVVLLLYFSYLFLVGALFFRFSNTHLDRVWLISSPFALGGAIALVGERLMFGGVHNSFYLAGWLMWLCPPCASPHFISYSWTPADFFVHAAVMPGIILLVSYLVPVRAAAHASD